MMLSHGIVFWILNTPISNHCCETNQIHQTDNNMNLQISFVYFQVRMLESVQVRLFQATELYSGFDLIQETCIKY
jgi:hypothetical protein